MCACARASVCVRVCALPNVTTCSITCSLHVWLFHTSARFCSVVILHLQIGEQNYYDMLGVNQNANLEQLKRAYRRIETKVHPDKMAAKSPLDEEKAAADWAKSLFCARIFFCVSCLWSLLLCTIIISVVFTRMSELWRVRTNINVQRSWVQYKQLIPLPLTEHWLPADPVYVIRVWGICN